MCFTFRTATTNDTNMAKSGKQAKKDHAAEGLAASANNEASLTATHLSALLEQHRAALTADFKSSFANLDTKLDQIQATVSGQGQRITDLESNAEEVNQRLELLEAMCTSLQGDNVQLKAKLSDLEGRSRRQNIRIVGLPESVEGNRPTAFFSQLLFDLFGEKTLSSIPELDRAHRSLAPKPGPKDRPRPVIIRFHRFQVKEQVIREARKRTDLEYNGHRLRFYDDYTADVLKQRAEYKDVMAELYKRGLRPSLLFPAKLRITLQNGEKKWVSSVSDATRFIDKPAGGSSTPP